MKIKAKKSATASDAEWTSPSNTTVIVHWPRIGPYHQARLEAAAALLAANQIKLIALEIYSASDEYLWENVSSTEKFHRYTLFPGIPARNISAPKLWQKIWGFLRHTQPAAAVLNGYSTLDSLGLLVGCRLRGIFPVLMSESKEDDSPRKILSEALKSLIVRQYGAALCGGTPHKAYLSRLGMPTQTIFDGYDAVDNQFFIQGSDAVRQAPQEHRRLPGLQDPRPFFLASGRFIARKNYLGLTQAYRRYREICQQSRLQPWRLVMLGDGPEWEALAREIAVHRLDHDIILAGVHPIKELLAYYGLASAFIHPALQEQWGLVVNEAMASALPVLVSSRAGCAKDLVEDGKDGLVFDPTNTAALGALMVQMSSGKVDLIAMGQAARQKIQAWGVERFAKNLLKALKIGLG